MSKIKNNKLIIIFILVLAIFIYEKFLAPSGETAISSEATFDKNIALVGNEFLDYLEKVKSIQIDDSLFKSTAWTNLKDFSKPLPEVSPGKDDLFVGQTTSVEIKPKR